MLPKKTIRHLILDRDGTIIEDRHYLSDPDGVALVPGTGQALGDLTASGVRLYLATNQSGIGRGYFEEKDYLAVQERLSRLLGRFGACFEDVAYCPHRPDDGCRCRKPETGLWESLAEANDLDQACTAMAGDKPSDVAFGLAGGLALVALVLTGKGQESARAMGLPEITNDVLVLEQRMPHWPHVVARDVGALAAWIMARNAALEAPLESTS